MAHCVIKSLTEEEGKITRGSLREYNEAVRGWYLGASKKEKGRILDKFTKVIGYHRNHNVDAFPGKSLARGYISINQTIV